MKNRASTLLLCLSFMIPVMAEEPALPEGLDTDSVEPDLPTGLDDEEPDLPLGLDVAPVVSGDQDEGEQLTPPEGSASEADNADLPFDLSGFWEARGGKRVVDDPNERDTSLAETRLQLQVEKHFKAASLYPLLYRLEERGWIAGRWVEMAGARRRRFYRLTPAGRKVLSAQRVFWTEFVAAVSLVTEAEHA